jgi:hypothetical protein
VFSGFLRYVEDICALLGYYAALSGNSLPTFRDNLSLPSSRDLKKVKEKIRGNLDFMKSLDDGTDRLSRNVGKELPLHAA